MAKKKSKAPVAPESDAKRSKRLGTLLAEGPAEVERYFEEAPIAELRELLEETYSSDLVNVLLDLRRSSVKAFFERLVSGRKRALGPAVALYHYKVYLTNPLPLELDAMNGEKLPNYYAILGVPRDASAEEIEEAQKLLLKAFAPSIFSPATRDMGEARREEIAEALSILKNPEKREAIDRLLPSINYLYPKREGCWVESVRQLLN